MLIGMIIAVTFRSDGFGKQIHPVGTAAQGNFPKRRKINGFTQCHACVVQTTTRYAGVHKKLYKKITNRITIRMFKSIVKKKGDFNGK